MTPVGNGKTAEPESNDPVVAALQSRLDVLEKEIERLTRLAAQSDDSGQQRRYWDLALDVQREARTIRNEIRRAKRPKT